MEVFEAILSRRSVREFTGEPVSQEHLNAILEAGRWAPSGLNNQPWKFKVVSSGEMKKELAECSTCGDIIKTAPLSIAVFLDGGEGYDRTKDVQSIGACIQNMLLAAHSLGLGAVWLGEILNKRVQAEKALGAPAGCELMAVVCVGHPLDKKRSSSRKALKDVVLG